MFRYLGLVWNSEEEAAAAAADHLRQPLQHHADWTRVAGTTGMEVFVTGAQETNNHGYSLGSHGVVLGKLFRRTPHDQFARPEDAGAIEDPERLSESGGRALIQDYWGRYVAFLRSSSRTATLVRDPSGSLPCYVMPHEGVHIVFSWLEDVLELLRSVPRPSIRWGSITAGLLMGESSGRLTALERVTQVCAGEAVDLGPTTSRHALLWNAADHARAIVTEDRLAAAHVLKQTAILCAAAWASRHPRLLLRLSGGVDSSILLACLANERVQADIVCLNYHSPGANSDERAFARLAATRFNRPLIERQRPASVALEPVLRIARMPSPSSYVSRITSSATDTDVARAHGATALLTGGGGDQLFFELHHWWPAADYLRNRGLDGGFLGAALDAARLGRVSIWEALRLALLDRFRSEPPGLDPLDESSLINPDALDPKHLVSHQHPVMLQANGLSIGKLTQLQILTAHGGYYDPFEGERAPELVNPFLSQPLIELCLGLPTYVLAHGGQGRALARQAFAAELPPEIAARRSKGGMSESVRSLLQDNLDFARSLLLDGELVGRGLLQRHRVEEALSGRPTTLASSAMEIHGLIATEAWIQRWKQ